MTTKSNIKARIVMWLLKKWNLIIFAFREGHPNENFGVAQCESFGEDGDTGIAENVLSLLIANCMEHRDERAKRIILGAAEKYLSRYEIDCKNFMKKVYNKN